MRLIANIKNMFNKIGTGIGSIFNKFTSWLTKFFSSSTKQENYFEFPYLKEILTKVITSINNSTLPSNANSNNDIPRNSFKFTDLAFKDINEEKRFNTFDEFQKFFEQKITTHLTHTTNHQPTAPNLLKNFIDIFQQHAHQDGFLNIGLSILTNSLQINSQQTNDHLIQEDRNKRLFDIDITEIEKGIVKLTENFTLKYKSESNKQLEGSIDFKLNLKLDLLNNFLTINSLTANSENKKLLNYIKQLMLHPTQTMLEMFDQCDDSSSQADSNQNNETTSTNTMDNITRFKKVLRFFKKDKSLPTTVTPNRCSKPNISVKD